ncbi:MAG TPA: hypothetical protein VL137_14750, partial [Polyangiaceae bacterium]|nr:hypothetical protein [Polyangiaceae bacterium]
GSALIDTPEANPVRAAYAAYFYGSPNSRSSWDLTAALYAARGASSYWDLVSVGYNKVEDDGKNAWQPSPDLEHSYLLKKADDATMESVLSDLMIKPPSVAQ